MGNDSPVEKQRSTSPFWRLSPRHNGSTLYDSYELQAVTRQINKAMLGSTGFNSPTYLRFMNSPFYRHRLDRIYRENEKTPKRIVCSIVTGATIGRKVSMRGTRPATAGFVTKLWKKVKGLLRNKQNPEM
ncbi:putative ATP-binding cassette sub-family D member 4 [Melia azedarach]|uniref:ATP-binding cassette sub-family D member 4 n=1 Tax=Melia azedarach TaxID=155640 RepID=A0ACC1XP28_MELAZ|nr:putative ATP-binding cassette sub-family D member 4 [Melia azedarach]